MDMEPEITYRDLEKSPEVEAIVQKQLERLERHNNHIISVHVALERRQSHMSSGSAYRVRVDVRVPPQHELIGTFEDGRGDEPVPLEQAINQAFQAVDRQIQSLREKQRGEVKKHDARP